MHFPSFCLFRKRLRSALGAIFAMNALVLSALSLPAHAAGAVATGSVAQAPVASPQASASSASSIAAEPKTPLSASSATPNAAPKSASKPAPTAKAASSGKSAPLSAEETLKAAADKVSQSKPRVIFSSDTPLAQSPLAAARAKPAALPQEAPPQTPAPATLPPAALPAESPATTAAIAPPLALPPLPGMNSGPLALPPLPSGAGIAQPGARSARRSPSIPGAEFTPAPTVYRAPPVCPSKALLAKAIVSFGGSFQADVCFGGELHPGLSLGDSIAGAKIVSISDNVVVLRSGRGKDQKLVVSQHFDE